MFRSSNALVKVLRDSTRMGARVQVIDAIKNLYQPGFLLFNCCPQLLTLRWTAIFGIGCFAASQQVALHWSAVMLAPILMLERVTYDVFRTGCYDVQHLHLNESILSRIQGRLIYATATGFGYTL